MMPPNTLTITVDVKNMSEVVVALRAEVVKIVREVADEESDSKVAHRLREIADRFEAAGESTS